MSSQNVERILRKVTQLQPLPDNISRLIWQIEKEDVSIDRLAGLISLDPALSAHVLRMSNSAELGYAHACSTVNDAVMYIGFTRLKSVLLSFPATNLLDKRLAGYHYDSGELWRHSLTTAIAAAWLAQTFQYQTVEEAYVAGLLHDLGKLLLDQYIVKNYSLMETYVQKYQMTLWQVEDKLIGINHARVGMLIAEHWQYPTVLVDAISYHHYPSFAKKSPALAAIINLANAFSKDFQPKKFSGMDNHEIHPETYNILLIDKARTEGLKMLMKESGIFPLI